jgi:lipoyl synthase
VDTLRKPPWLMKRLSFNGTVQEVRTLMRKQSLNTVCESARCPNLGECWSRRTATFLIMGNVCTRSCRYCAISTGRPRRLDPAEPERVAEAAVNLGLRHVVVTSVARDELPDGGAAHFAATIHAIRRRIDSVVVEVLIPDFKGEESGPRATISAP